MADQFNHRRVGDPTLATKEFTVLQESILKTIFIAGLAASMLCACGFMTPAKQYAGDAQEPKGIAVIKGYVGVPFSGDYHATISGYTKIELPGDGEQKKFGLPGFTDYPKEIHVLAGDYKVHVYCFKGFASYRPSTTLLVQPGKTYVLKCDVRDGEATVSVKASGL
jgi:hypothetical protein